MSPQQELGGTPGGKERQLRGADLERTGDVEPLGKRLDHALEAKVVAPADQGQPGRLVGQGLAGVGQVDVGDLEQLGIGISMRFVVPPDCQQARHQALAQRILAPAARMVDPDRRLGRARLQRGGQRVGDEAERHRFVEPAAGQCACARGPRSARAGRAEYW